MRLTGHSSCLSRCFFVVATLDVQAANKDSVTQKDQCKFLGAALYITQHNEPLTVLQNVLRHIDCADKVGLECLPTTPILQCC